MIKTDKNCSRFALRGKPKVAELIKSSSPSLSPYHFRSRIIILVSLCVIFAAITAVILIQTSEMRRLYIRSIGFVDAGVEGYQMVSDKGLINFQFLLLSAYQPYLLHLPLRLNHLLHHPILPHPANDPTSDIKKNRPEWRATSFYPALYHYPVLRGLLSPYQLTFINSYHFQAMCAVFEYINTRDWSKNTVEKINLVAILNIVNYLPEISLPLMLLISNTDMRRRIATIVGPRVTKSATVSVVPLQ